MPVDLAIAFDNKMHLSYGSASISAASSTAPGFSQDYVRHDNLASAWKPNNTTSDEYVRQKLTSSADLGAAAGLAWWGVAFDYRSADQSALKLYYYTDEVGFTGKTLIQNYTSQPKDGVKCGLRSFTIPTPARQYYEIDQLNADRGGSNVTGKVLYSGLYADADVLQLGVDFPSHGEGPFDVTQIFRNGRAETAGGHVYMNKWGAPGQRFTVAVSPADDSLAETFLMPYLNLVYGDGVAVFVQHTGLQGGAKVSGVPQNVFLCRLVGMQWNARRTSWNQYFVEMEFETLPWV